MTPRSLLLLGLLAVAWLEAVSARAADLPVDSSAIYVSNVDGSEARLLARVEGHVRHEFPRWSHDGKRVAFNAKPNGHDVRKIFIVDADGKNLRDVGEGAMPDWSPNDALLACYLFGEGGGATLAIKSMTDGQVTQLTRGKSPRWSVDGSQLVAADDRALFQIDLETAKSTDLINTGVNTLYRGFSFSSDGARLAVVVGTLNDQKRQLLIGDLSGAAPTFRQRLTSDLGGVVSFSPDAKQLVYSSGFRLYVVEVDGTQGSRLVPQQRGRNHHPHWSPDGRSFVFVSDRKDPSN